MKMLGFFLQTPLASPLVQRLWQKEKGRRAARSLLPQRGTSWETAKAQWLPNLHNLRFLALTQAYWIIGSSIVEKAIALSH
ncbi:hypothetical protein [Nostoc sp.]|uniref:hypothetical protein n=1 Tax=Nostoc sp. TaxID=1180 RepID=UPI002FFBC789